MKKRIIFMGTPVFACSILKQLLIDEYDVIAVVSQPDKKVGRKQEIQMTPVKTLALENNIPVYQPVNIRNEYEMLVDLKPDMIVTCAYGQFIPKALLDCATFGCVNVHASLLPKLRGGAPIHKAIINGDSESGVTIMRMVEKMDAGAMISQSVVKIEDNDTMGSLHDKLMVCGAKLLSETLPLIFEGKHTETPQNEDEVTYAWNISKEEELIDFSKSIEEVYNQIRGLIPAPVAYTFVQGKKLKVYAVSLKYEKHDFKDGEIVGLIDNGVAIAHSTGYLLFNEVQLEGKKKVSAKEFMNGAGRNLLHKIAGE